MSDKAQTVKVSRSLTVDGEKIEFPRLDIFDLFQIGDNLKSDREAKARTLASQMHLGKYEEYNIVNAIQTATPTVQEVLAYASTPQGAVEVDRCSLRKTDRERKTHDDILRNMSIPDCVDVARSLILSVPDELPKEDGTESPLTEQAVSSNS